MSTKKKVTSTTVDEKFCLIQKESRDVPNLVEKKISGKDYIFYGDDNDFPSYLWNLYLKSPISSGIINGTIDFISGNEVTFNHHLTEINKEGDKIDDLIRKISTDYMIYGGFAMQILRNRLGEISEIYWIDVQDIRTNEDETKYYYSKNWNKYGAKVVVYEKYDPDKQQPTSIFYFKGHKTRGVYPIPTYVGGLAAIETSTEIGKFHLNNILNNLSSSAIINFNNGVPSTDEQKQIEKRVKEKFSGAQNAGKFIVTFNDNKESATTVERLSEDRMDEKFNTLAKSTMQNIFISFRAYPELFGMSTEGNGFSLAEYEESFKLYDKTVVQPIQKDIIRCFEKIFKQEGVLSFIPFKLNTIEG